MKIKSSLLVPFILVLTSCSSIKANNTVNVSFITIRDVNYFNDPLCVNTIRIKKYSKLTEDNILDVFNSSFPIDLDLWDWSYSMNSYTLLNDNKDKDSIFDINKSIKKDTIIYVCFDFTCYTSYVRPINLAEGETMDDYRMPAFTLYEDYSSERYPLISKRCLYGYFNTLVYKPFEGNIIEEEYVKELLKFNLISNYGVCPDDLEIECYSDKYLKNKISFPYEMQVEQNIWIGYSKELITYCRSNSTKKEEECVNTYFEDFNKFFDNKFMR